MSSLDIDRDSKVLDGAGEPITGLPSCGNDAASIVAGTYPGPGTTLGPALVLAHRIGIALAGTQQRAS